LAHATLATIRTSKVGFSDLKPRLGTVSLFIQ
jgi:hypothetical protein